jgi:hypothetical protein
MAQATLRAEAQGRPDALLGCPWPRHRADHENVGQAGGVGGLADWCEVTPRLAFAQ